MFAKHIGQHMRRARLQKQMIQEELAFKASYSTSFIAKIETGRYSPSFHTIWRMAHALRLKLTTFLKDKDFETDQ